jgi:predicted dehydrogenase
MKIALMSFAHMHAESYLTHLLADPSVQLIGAADDDPARGRAGAAKFNLPYFDSYDALLAQRPAAVLVCSENARHRAHVELAAAAGAHVLCEKPLAPTVEDAQAMVAACQRAGVTLMTAFPMRYSTPLMEVKARLDAGDLGRVYSFAATNQGRLPAGQRPWFVDPALAGGGAVMDHTVHVADVLRWYLDSPVVEVYAATTSLLHPGLPVETGGLLMLTFANGVFASLDCSWSRPPYYATWGNVAFEMVTDRGAVLVDAFRQNLTVYRHDLQRPTTAHWGSDNDQAMLADFLQAVRAGRPPRVTGLDGLRATEVVAAAYESVRTGQPVTPTSE